MIEFKFMSDIGEDGMERLRGSLRDDIGSGVGSEPRQ